MWTNQMLGQANILILCSTGPAEAQACDFLTRWFETVDGIQAAQPRWMTPLATVTARLEDEWRSDVLWTQRPGDTLLNVGGGKGHRPSRFFRWKSSSVRRRTFSHANRAIADGFGDVGVLVKYRLLTANEQRGEVLDMNADPLSIVKCTNCGALKPLAG
ncbi:MAG: hypothetical protein C5B57_11780 [Blastocatellia bacterium]|nr:MAG: hypothetical protein C5B57_11780 [Blastocatellia bacterium]